MAIFTRPHSQLAKQQETDQLKVLRIEGFTNRKVGEGRRSLILHCAPACLSKREALAELTVIPTTVAVNKRVFHKPHRAAQRRPGGANQTP